MPLMQGGQSFQHLVLQARAAHACNGLSAQIHTSADQTCQHLRRIWLSWAWALAWTAVRVCSFCRQGICFGAWTAWIRSASLSIRPFGEAFLLSIPSLEHISPPPHPPPPPPPPPHTQTRHLACKSSKQVSSFNGPLLCQSESNKPLAR